MSAAFFIGFFMMQLPLGHWLDQYGSRKSESFLLLIAVLGSVLFVTAQEVSFLTLGRWFIGIGVSSCLMSAFAFYGRWFKPEYQGPLASAMLMCGTAGAMLMTIPVQMALPTLGWRSIFWIMVVLLVISVFVIYFGIPKASDPTPVVSKHQQKKSFDWLQAYLPIIQSGNFKQVFPMGIFNIGGFYAIQTLWLGNWFRDYIGLSEPEVANYLFLFNLMLLLGYAANMFIPRILQQMGLSIFKYVAIFSGLALLMQALALYMPKEHSAIYLFLFALLSTVFILGQSVFNQFFPRSISGKASTSINILIFGGAFMIQWGIGFLMDWLILQGSTKSEAINSSFKVLIILQGLSFLWMLVAPYVIKKRSFLPIAQR
jgi:MFS family permease